MRYIQGISYILLIDALYFEQNSTANTYKDKSISILMVPCYIHHISFLLFLCYDSTIYNDLIFPTKSRTIGLKSSLKRNTEPYIHFYQKQYPKNHATFNFAFQHSKAWGKKWAFSCHIIDIYFATALCLAFKLFSAMRSR